MYEIIEQILCSLEPAVTNLVVYVWGSQRVILIFIEYKILGLQPGDKIAIYAETREEWIVSALGAFAQNITGKECHSKNQF